MNALSDQLLHIIELAQQRHRDFWPALTQVDPRDTPHMALTNCLEKVVRAGTMEQLNALLSYNNPSNARYLFLCACASGRIEMMERLGTDVKFFDDEALVQTVYSQSLNAVQWMLERYPTPEGSEALMKAAWLDNIEIIHRLAPLYQPINIADAWSTACTKEDEIGMDKAQGILSHLSDQDLHDHQLAVPLFHYLISPQWTGPEQLAVLQLLLQRMRPNGPDGDSDDYPLAWARQKCAHSGHQQSWNALMAVSTREQILENDCKLMDLAVKYDRIWLVDALFDMMNEWQVERVISRNLTHRGESMDHLRTLQRSAQDKHILSQTLEQHVMPARMTRKL